MSATLADLLDALAGAPALPGARCRGRAHLFDPGHPGEPVTVTEARHCRAVALCQRCPALDACGNWMGSLPPRKRPPGVIAGTIRTDPDRREAATA